jgi:mono/diheme cytochrome c family protein
MFAHHLPLHHVVLAACLIVSATPSFADTAQRGKYLATIGVCNDCHTPGALLGKPDFTRALSGSEVGFALPDGIFYGPNLTPDKETGLGNWSADEIVAAITKGVRPDGRELAPIMPWHYFAALTKDDAYAIAAYLKSLPPMKNKVPGPFGPGEKPSSFVMKVIPPAK